MNMAGEKIKSGRIRDRDTSRKRKGIAKNKHCSPLRCTKAIVVDLNVYKEEERVKDLHVTKVETKLESVIQNHTDNYFVKKTPRVKVINKPYTRRYTDVKSKYRTSSFLKNQISHRETNTISTNNRVSSHKRVGSSSFINKKAIKTKLEARFPQYGAISSSNLTGKGRNMERVHKTKMFRSPRLKLALQVPQDRKAYRSGSKSKINSEQKKNSSIDEKGTYLRK